jgi:hypothetical protein
VCHILFAFLFLVFLESSRVALLLLRQAGFSTVGFHRLLSLPVVHVPIPLLPHASLLRMTISSLAWSRRALRRGDFDAVHDE